jgi:WD40 repeat protein
MSGPIAAIRKSPGEYDSPASPGSSHRFKVFISYSRRDLAAAEAIVLALEQRGFEVVIDKRDLPYGEEWQVELADFIRNSDTVVWLVSPDSISSRWCNWELGEVVRLRKRLVPVRIREIDIDSLPDAIGKIHLFPLDRIFSADTDHDHLADILNTDRAWLKEGTRLANRAQLWLTKQRDGSLLLRGGELADAERWTSRKPNAAPPIPGEVLELLWDSRRASSRRQKWMVGGALGIAIGSLCLAGIAFYQRNEALISQSLFLSKLSRDNAEAGDSATAVLLALAGLPTWKSGYDRPLVTEALRSLNDSLYSLRESSVYRGHTADVNTVSAHPSEPIVLTSSDDHTARLWHAPTGRLLHILSGHQDKISQAIFSFNGNLAATASADRSAKIWDTATGELRRTFVGHSGAVNSVEFDRTATRLVTSSADGTARIWSVDGGASLVLRGHDGPVNSASFSEDGHFVLTTSNDTSAALWSAASGDLVRKLTGHRDDVIGGQFDASGSRVVTFSHDNTARLWDAHTGDPLRTLAHEDWVRSAAFCPDRPCIVTASDDKTVRIWDLEAGGKATVLQHSDAVRKAVINRRGNRIATGGRDGLIVLWSRTDDAEYKKELTLAGHTAGLLDIAFDARDEYLATSSRLRNSANGVIDGTARLWRLLAPTSAAASLETPSIVQRIAPSPNGAYVATAHLDGTIALWDMKTYRQARKITAHEGAVISVAFSADGTRLITASQDGSAAVWRTPELVLERRSPRRTSPISDASFSHRGNRAILGSYDGTVMIWDFDSGSLSELEHYPVAAVSAQFAPRSELALAAFLDGTAKIWNLDAGVVKELRGHRGALRHAAFSPKHEWVITSAEDGRSIVWDPATANALYEFNHNGIPTFADFSDDDNHVVAAVDGTASILKIGESLPIATYRGHLGGVNAVRFVRQSKALVSASSDGTMQVWGFKTQFFDLVSLARQLTPRCLTLDQANRFGVPFDAAGRCGGGQPQSVQ